jgi:hypothetical protein
LHDGQFYYDGTIHIGLADPAKALESVLWCVTVDTTRGQRHDEGLGGAVRKRGKIHNLEAYQS